MDDIASLIATRTIVRTAVPAILYSVVPPTVVAAELAALAHVRGGGPPSQGAFAATGAAVSFLVSSANFLVNGISAQVGASAASGHWKSLRGRVRVALGAGVVVGLVWGIVLAASRDFVVERVFALRPDAARAARPFLSLRAAALPFVLTNSAIAGTLQGYGKVGASAALASLAAALEAAAVAFLLLRQQNAAGGSSRQHRFVPPLELVGLASLAASAVATLAGLFLVQTAAPERSKNPLGLSKVFQLFSSTGRGTPEGMERLPTTTTTAAAAETSSSSSPRFLLAPATTVVPDEDTHGGTDLDTLPLIPSSSSRSASRGQQQQDGEDYDDEEEEPPLSLGKLVAELASGGFFLFGRSIVLQTTFLCGAAVASRRGTAALAAHATLAQLWMAVSYFVDGLETAACVLGSRLAAVAKGGGGAGVGGGTRSCVGGNNNNNNSAKQAFASLARRLLSGGVAIGLLYSAAFAAFRGPIARLFTSDEGALEFLLHGPAWPIVLSAQALNAAVFVCDGLVYSIRSFKGAFVTMFASFLIFVPVLAISAAVFDTQVFPIWLGKAAMNIGRLSGLAFLLRREFRSW